jgi:hypothetical protein
MAGMSGFGAGAGGGEEEPRAERPRSRLDPSRGFDSAGGLPGHANSALCWQFNHHEWMGAARAHASCVMSLRGDFIVAVVPILRHEIGQSHDDMRLVYWDTARLASEGGHEPHWLIGIGRVGHIDLSPDEQLTVVVNGDAPTVNSDDYEVWSFDLRDKFSLPKLVASGRRGWPGHSPDQENEVHAPFFTRAMSADGTPLWVKRSFGHEGLVFGDNRYRDSSASLARTHTFTSVSPSMRTALVSGYFIGEPIVFEPPLWMGRRVWDTEYGIHATSGRMGRTDDELLLSGYAAAVDQYFGVSSLTTRKTAWALRSGFLQNPAIMVAAARDTRHLASIDTNTVAVWNQDDLSRPLWSLTLADGGLRRVDISADGRFVLVGSKRGFTLYTTQGGAAEEAISLLSRLKGVDESVFASISDFVGPSPWPLELARRDESALPPPVAFGVGPSRGLGRP